MRELEFRAWNKKEKKMGKVLSINRTDGGTLAFIVLYDKGGMTFETENTVTLMQCTGVRDHLNKTKVYEDDIIQDDIHSDDGDRFYVTYSPDEGCYRCCDRYGQPCYHLGMWLAISDLTFKVIGNRYENPELLEENR